MIIVKEISELKNHPKNAEIYQDEKVDDLVLSIGQYGLKEPITINPQNLIISGHRRVQALRQLNEKHVQCRVMEFKTPEDELVFLITQNEYRVKTNEEKIREGALLEEIESLRAEARMKAGIPPSGLIETGRTRDVVAKKIGLSGETYRKGKTVIQAIDKLKEKNPEKAAMLQKELRQSISKAAVIAGNKKTHASPKPSPGSIETTYAATLLAVQGLKNTLALLNKTKSRFTARCVIDLIGEIENMLAYFETWKPANTRPCTEKGCTGGAVITPQGHSVKCPVCMGGRVPG